MASPRLSFSDALVRSGQEFIVDSRERAVTSEHEFRVNFTLRMNFERTSEPDYSYFMSSWTGF